MINLFLKFNNKLFLPWEKKDKNERQNKKSNWKPSKFKLGLQLNNAGRFYAFPSWLLSFSYFGATKIDRRRFSDRSRLWSALCWLRGGFWRGGHSGCGVTPAEWACHGDWGPLRVAPCRPLLAVATACVTREFAREQRMPRSSEEYFARNRNFHILCGAQRFSHWRFKLTTRHFERFLWNYWLLTCWSSEFCVLANPTPPKGSLRV